MIPRCSDGGARYVAQREEVVRRSMGAAASVVGGKKAEVMSVDPVPNRRVRVFAKQIFRRYEWVALKTFCLKYKIAQVDLVRVFQKYLSHDEVYLREFRVRCADIKSKFLYQSKLQKEIVDLFVPMTYLVDFKGLEPVADPEEISFARFVILTYILCCQQLPDLVYVFISVLKQKLNLPIGTVVPYFSFQQLALLLFEDLQSSGAVDALKYCLAKAPPGAETRVKTIIRMGVKYPLLFYSIQRFRRIFQRQAFGDKFWTSRKTLKLKHISLADCKEDLAQRFETEASARKHTALMLIADCVYAASASTMLDDMFHEPPTTLTEKDVVKVKNRLGYKLAKRLVLESQLPLEFDPIFLQNFVKKGDEASLSSPRLICSPGGTIVSAPLGAVEETRPATSDSDGAAAPRPGAHGAGNGPAARGDEDECVLLGAEDLSGEGDGSDDGDEGDLPAEFFSVDAEDLHPGSQPLPAPVPAPAPAPQLANAAGGASVASISSLGDGSIQTAGSQEKARDRSSRRSEPTQARAEDQDQAPTSPAGASNENSDDGDGSDKTSKSLASRISQRLAQSSASIRDIVAAAADPDTYLADDGSSILSRLSVKDMLKKALLGSDEDEFYYEDEEDEPIQEAYDAHRPALERPVGAVILHDAKFDRDFAFDVLSGRSRWDKIIYDPNGKLYRQSF